MIEGGGDAPYDTEPLRDEDDHELRCPLLEGRRDELLPPEP